MKEYAGMESGKMRKEKRENGEKVHGEKRGICDRLMQRERKCLVLRVRALCDFLFFLSPLTFFSVHCNQNMKSKKQNKKKG